MPSSGRTECVFLVHPEPAIRKVLERLVGTILRRQGDQAPGGKVLFQYTSSLSEVKKTALNQEACTLILAHITDPRPGSEDIKALRELRGGKEAWLGAFIGFAYSARDSHQVFTKEERHPVIEYFFRIDQLKKAIRERKGISRTEQCIFWQRVFCEPEYVKSQASLLIHEATKGKWPSVELCIENLENCVGKQRPDLVKHAREYCKKKITEKLLWENLLQPLLEGTYE